MDISIKALFLRFVAEKYHGLSKTEGHCCFSILAKTFFVSGTVHQNLRTLNHKAFHKTFVLVAVSGTHRRIKIAKMKILYFGAAKYLFAAVSHTSKVVASPHAGCHINVQIVDQR